MSSEKQKNPLVLTLIVKIIFLTMLFIGVPYFFVTQLDKYQQTATGILSEENAVLKIQTDKTTQMKVLTQVEANTLSQIHDYIEGTWVSEHDGRYKIQIDLNNKFIEYYDSNKEGYGVWRVFAGSQNDVNLSDSLKINGRIYEPQEAADASSVNSNNTSTSVSLLSPSAYTKSQFDNTSTDDSKFFFQKQQYESGHKGEQYVYQIQQLDTEKFVLVFKGGPGRPLVFVRTFSSSSLPDFLH
ncbi:MAG: hypothetical protein K9M11_04525 [Candidatus Pacebacteria bacterium]|nr:hypothetical protein [Candidatus Paceibacterota bacterium]